jgi:DNA-directed RNA polymerase specialized sigma24 family protein
MRFGSLTGDDPKNTLMPDGPSTSSARDPNLERSLDHLPEPQRGILLWRHRDHLPFEEIARRLGLSLAEAQAAWFRALEALSREMERSDGRAGPEDQ